MNDDICAIATPIGRGGISIIRITGDNVFLKLDYLFPSIDLTELPANSLTYNKLIIDGKIFDEVMLGKMTNPASYTGLDTLEINCHGGVILTNQILEEILKNDIRLAEPGEFTKLSFLNGKKDLNQAQSVMNLIDAKNSYALEFAQNHLLKRENLALKDIHQNIMDILTNLAVNIDYPEYVDIKELTTTELHINIDSLIKKVSAIIENSQKGELIKNGIKTVIIGRPNVGKSSLFNLLVKSNRAIVTEIAGTTRDVLESEVNIGNINLILLDTAGLRETEDVIEKIGINRSFEAVSQSELIILMVDGTVGISENERKIIAENSNKKIITIVNKKDLSGWKTITDLPNVLNFSVKDNIGISSLEKKVTDIFGIADFDLSSSDIVLQMDLLAKLKNVENKLRDLQKKIDFVHDLDLLEIDFREISVIIGDILGLEVKENFMDELFKNFCLGK